MTHDDRLILHIALFGGEVVTIRIPVPMSHRNFERVQRILADQMEPLVEESRAAEEADALAGGPSDERDATEDDDGE